MGEVIMKPDGSVESGIPAIKAGWKTTEFWFSLVTAIVGGLLSSGIFPESSTSMKLLGLAAMILSGLGYTLSRTVAKK